MGIFVSEYFKKPLNQRLSYRENPKQKHKPKFHKKTTHQEATSSSFGVGLGNLTWMFVRAGINLKV